MDALASLFRPSPFANRPPFPQTANATVANSIVLNGLGSMLSATGPGFFVAPVQDKATTANLAYNPTTGEITYDSSVRRRLSEEDFGARLAALEEKYEARLKALETKLEALTAQ